MTMRKPWNFLKFTYGIANLDFEIILRMCSNFDTLYVFWKTKQLVLAIIMLTMLTLRLKSNKRGGIKMIDEADIANVQDNLSLIRQIGGWTTVEFGKLIGISDQTVRNLESGSTDKNDSYKMTKTQYLAIRTVLEDAISEGGENKEKLECIYSVFYKNNRLTTEDKKKAVAWTSGASKANLSDEVTKEGLFSLLGDVAKSLAIFGGLALIAKSVSKSVK